MAINEEPVSTFCKIELVENIYFDYFLCKFQTFKQLVAKCYCQRNIIARNCGDGIVQGNQDKKLGTFVGALAQRFTRSQKPTSGLCQRDKAQNAGCLASMSCRTTHPHRRKQKLALALPN
jgi:hypothetical protein